MMSGAWLEFRPAPGPLAFRARQIAGIPLRRYGQPEAFGRFAAFVLSPAALHGRLACGAEPGVAAGRHAERCLERAGEVGLVGEPGFERGFGQGPRLA
jgi:NAD(P)-dependent dehydrogenase (short-subunit alcohol dehydrogenase family)